MLAVGTVRVLAGLLLPILAFLAAATAPRIPVTIAPDIVICGDGTLSCIIVYDVLSR